MPPVRRTRPAEGGEREGGERRRRREPVEEYAEQPYEEEEQEEYAEYDVRLPAVRAGQAGQRQIAELTGKEVVGVTSLEPTDDGWLVGVEVVEDHRIPTSIDLLGLYQVEIDNAGEMLAYQRLRRYPRGKGEGS